MSVAVLEDSVADSIADASRQTKASIIETRRPVLTVDVARTSMEPPATLKASMVDAAVNMDTVVNRPDIA